MKIKSKGFTLVELLITMAVLILVLAASSNTFVSMLRQYRQQSSISETNISSITSLDSLRMDIESAGYGLPWVIPSEAPDYTEGTSAPESNYNDAPRNPPRPIQSDDNAGFNNSDILVIKSSNIRRDTYSNRWTYLTFAAPNIKSWDIAAQNPAAGDYALILSPGSNATNRRTLVVVGGTWKAFWNTISTFYPGERDPQPLVVYDLGNSAPAMPFHRADYYILDPAAADPLKPKMQPDRCAPNTGELVKAVVTNDANGKRGDLVPVLDCVADMQAVFRLDTDNDKKIDTVTGNISALTAQQMRDQIREIRVYLLTHEGQMDRGFTYPASNIYVGESGIGQGHLFDLGTNLNYRWKIYTIAVNPQNMR